MKIDILYEDQDVLVINKPSGLVVHSDGKTAEPNLSEWILSKYPEIKEVGEPIKTLKGEVIFRPGIVHRLDRDTSGVMVVAKNERSFQNLKEQFKNHKIEKVYNAFVWGEIKEETGKIDRPIGRSSKDFRMWSAQRGARGELREAITEYKVLLKKNGYSFVEVRPKTGRTHQIRVHFKAINHPLVSDPLYSPKRENELRFSRTALHSKELVFSGINGDFHRVQAPFPEDFAVAISILQSM